MPRKKKQTYVAAAGAKFDDAKAQVLGNELNRLETVHGGVTPTLVVDEARDPSSPFHNHFEWDDTKAASRWRRDQARELIQAIRVRVRFIGDKDGDPRVVRARAFSSVQDDGGHKYVSLRAVNDSETYREQLVLECVEEGRMWADKARIYKELDHIVSAIDEAYVRAAKASSKAAPRTTKQKQRTQRRRKPKRELVAV